MLRYQDVVLRYARIGELADLYRLVTADENWTRFNGPYFPYSAPSVDEFEHDLFARLCAGERIQLITLSDKPIGSVSYYWECEATRWLEVGVIIYDSDYWGQGIGRIALIPWISHLFATLNIERVGLTTWSGNPRMMACAKKLGLQLEARLRKVRYYNGHYYDSVKYGVLREEWSTLSTLSGHQPVNPP